MPDNLTTITNLINSPPGQLVAGGVLAGFVWKLFDKWATVASEEDQIRVWMWLADRNTTGFIQRWQTFDKLFDAVFGPRHLSVRCFVCSAIASMFATLVAFVIAVSTDTSFILMPDGKTLIPQSAWITFRMKDAIILLVVLAFTVIPDYISLLKTRVIVRWLAKYLPDKLRVLGLCFLADLSITTLISVFTLACLSLIVRLPTVENPLAVGYDVGDLDNMASILLHPLGSLQLLHEMGLWYMFYPAYWTSVWVALYVSAGFIVKAEFIKRHFDIEKKPLQSIGLVAGALVAVVYWAAAIVSRIVG
jgi:hypothetical protein